MSLVKNIDTNTIRFVESSGSLRVVLSPKTMYPDGNPTVLPQILFANIDNGNGDLTLDMELGQNPQNIDGLIDINGDLIILANPDIDDVNNYSIDSNGNLIYEYL